MTVHTPAPAPTPTPTSTPTPARRVDPRAARFAQGVTAVLLVVAFLLDLALLVPLVALSLLAPAAFGPKANVWGRLFAHGIRPALRLRAPSKAKDAAPIRFAQTLGAAFLIPASIMLLVPALTTTTTAIVAWALALAVASLAGLAAATDLCLGCILYSTLLRARRTPVAAPEGRP